VGITFHWKWNRHLYKNDNEKEGKMNTSDMMDKMYLMGQLKSILEAITNLQDKKTKIEQQIDKLKQKE
jgi:hypothetical protein